MLSRTTEVEMRWLAARHFRNMKASAIKLWLVLLALSDDGGEIVRAHINLRTLGLMIGLKKKLSGRVEMMMQELAARGLLLYRRRPFSVLLLVGGRPFKSLMHGLLVPPRIPIGHVGAAYIVPSKVRATPPPPPPPSLVPGEFDMLAWPKIVFIPLRVVQRMRYSTVKGALPPFSDDTGFRRFWLAYGRRQNKTAALLAWLQLGLSAHTDAIVAAAKEWTAAVQDLPMPDVFLRLGYWKSPPPPPLDNSELMDAQSIEEFLATQVSALLASGGVPERMLERYVRTVLRTNRRMTYDEWEASYRRHGGRVLRLLDDGMGDQQERLQSAVGGYCSQVRGQTKRARHSHAHRSARALSGGRHD